MGDLSRIAYPMIIGMLNTKCGAMHPIGQPSTNPSLTGGIRQNLFEIYYFEKITCNARALASRAIEGRRDESTVNNLGFKLKIQLTGALGNLLLFP